MQFSGRNWSNSMLVPPTPFWGWRTPLWEILDPPLDFVDDTLRNTWIFMNEPNQTEKWMEPQFNKIDAIAKQKAHPYITWTVPWFTIDFIILLLLTSPSCPQVLFFTWNPYQTLRPYRKILLWYPIYHAFNNSADDIFLVKINQIYFTRLLYRSVIQQEKCYRI